MQIDIRVTEVLSRVINVDAVSVEEAIEIVRNKYHDEEIVLDYSDFDADVRIEHEKSNLNLGQTFE
jgi:hypothetical protein